MTVDFRRLKHFSMTYVFTHEEDIACEYEQTEQDPSVAVNGDSVSFRLINIDQDEDQDVYSITLLKEGDEFYIKSDYFDDADEAYPLDVEMTNDDIRFVLEGEGEVMYLYGFFE